MIAFKSFTIYNLSVLHSYEVSPFTSSDNKINYAILILKTQKIPMIINRELYKICRSWKKRGTLIYNLKSINLIFLKILCYFYILTNEHFFPTSTLTTLRTLHKIYQLQSAAASQISHTTRKSSKMQPPSMIEDEVKESGYTEGMVYRDITKQPTTKKHNRRRNIIWFNLP